MPWQQQGGGGGGPWGSGPRGSQPPDLEEMIRKGQERFRNMMPGGMAGGKMVVLAALGIALLWMFTGFYRVQPGERGVELLFGRFVKETGAGLHYWAPSPFGEVLKPNVQRTNEITVGFRGAGSDHASTIHDVPQESLMLTGEANIIDIDYVVQWRIKNARDYLFHIRNVGNTIKLASESAIREVVGQTPLEDALALKRVFVEQRTKDLLQKILDDYGAGVFIVDIKMQKVDPPQPVIDAFNDVQRARQDKDREKNEAEAYSQDILPKAEGEAQRLIQEATAYREQLIKEAEGEAARFLSVYNAYKGGKDVTIRRLYLERMQEVLKNSQKIIIDSDKGSPGVVPYLPLPEIEKRRTGASPAGGGR